MTVTNYITGNVEQAPPGSQVIVREEFVSVTSLLSDHVPTPQTNLQPQPEARSPFRGPLMRQGLGIVRRSTSTSTPVSVGIVGTGNTDPPDETGKPGGTTSTETSTNPSPVTRPARPLKRPAPVTVIFLDE
jgi:hypothetical protein